MADREGLAMIWVLAGHRGTGKTTIGRRAAEFLHRTFVDIDERITENTGRPPEDWFPEAQVEFRALEISTLDDVSEGALVSAGGGIERIPSRMAVIWLYREGWEEIAKIGRKPLHPTLALDDEILWMKQTREPKYFSWADAKLEMMKGESSEQSAARLVDLIELLERSMESSLLKRSWWIGSPDRIERQIARAAQVGAAGVEIRSDLFSSERVHDLKLDPDHVLFSLRTSESAWLEPEMAHVDIDLKDLTQFSKDANRRCEIISSHSTLWSAPSFPPGSKEVKWAPILRNFSDMANYSAWAADLRSRHSKVTVLPQQKRWEWLRIYEAVKHNFRNYLSGTAETHSAGSPPWSRWSLYAHAGRNAKVYGLVGDPVEYSAGPVFHNRYFRKTGENAIYLAIPVPPDELAPAIEVLSRMEFAGLSVTAPHKKVVLSLKNIQADSLSSALGATNTLKRNEDGSWSTTNTDVAGMRATLNAVEAELGAPTFSEFRRVLILGQGGVTTALEKALDERVSFQTQVVSARDVEISDLFQNTPWDMIINASGRDILLPMGKRIRVWIDLRYGRLASNGGGEHFFAGDAFFETQALEQLRFWGFSPAEETR